MKTTETRSGLARQLTIASITLFTAAFAVSFLFADGNNNHSDTTLREATLNSEESSQLPGSNCRPGEVLIIVTEPESNETTIDYFRKQAEPLISQFDVVSIEHIQAYNDFQARKSASTMDEKTLLRAEDYFRLSRFSRLLVIKTATPVDLPVLLDAFSSHPSVEHAQGNCSQ